MKKLLLLLTVMVLGFALTACEDAENVCADGEAYVDGECKEYVEPNPNACPDGEAYVDGECKEYVEPTTLPEIPAEVGMDKIDEFLGRADVQYVDLRNFQDKMNGGYIAGFEFIPFFDYLEFENILVRNTGWDFTSADIVNETALKALFDMDKTIFLMCGSGTRAGYVKAALESIGYTDVINVGGISSYAGVNKVDGDGVYINDPVPRGAFTPGVYVGYDGIGQYITTVTVNDHGAIVDVVFDAFNRGQSKLEMGPAYGMRTKTNGWTWAEMSQVLSDYVVANQGFGDFAFEFVAFDENWNALNVPHHIIENDVDANSPDAVAGVTAGLEGFVFSWNKAIAQASDSNLGVVATDVTYEQWQAAHENAFAYVDGTYYGYSDGYSAKVTVEGGFIADVFLDSLHCRDNDADGVKETCNTKRSYTYADYPMNLVLNDNGTELDETDDFYEVAAGRLSWWEQADKLAEAVLDAQTFSPEWAIYDDGSHDRFSHMYDASGWSTWLGDQWSGETTSEFEVEGEMMVVDVKFEGTPATYATQLFQEGFALEQGKFYQISFDAKAGEAKDIVVAFGDALDADPWFTDFVAKSTHTLGTEWNTYTIEFEMTEATTEDQGKLVFELATAVNTKVYIDNVMLQEIDALGGSVVADTDQVMYGDFDFSKFDAVAGVTLGIESWKLAIEEALNKALGN